MDRAKEALAFSLGYSFPQYAWHVMPQGVKPASHCFQQTMEKKFCNLEHCILPPFYDDVIIKGEMFQQPMVNVRLVLTKVRESGFTLNALKCKFFETRISYLGHLIENGHISLAPDKIKAIIDFPVPNNTYAICRFIGMTQFCNRIIENLNPILAPFIT